MFEIEKVRSRIRRIRISRKNRVRIITTLALVTLLTGVFYAGDHHGAKRQKSYDDKHQRMTPAAKLNPLSASAATNRWSAVGTIQELTDKSLKVKSYNGGTQEAMINKKTSIIDKAAKKVGPESLQKDSKIIISGTKDDKGKLTATFIRLQ